MQLRALIRTTYERSIKPQHPPGKAVYTAGLRWAHVRRRFYELAAAGPAPIASETLQRLGELYAVEQDIRKRSVFTLACPHGVIRLESQCRVGVGATSELAGGAPFRAGAPGHSATFPLLGRTASGAGGT